MKIINNGKKIGEITFDSKSDIFFVKFEGAERESYRKVFSLLIDRIKKRAYPDLFFDPSNGRVENCNKGIILAIKQELFMDLEWVLVE